MDGKGRGGKGVRLIVLYLLKYSDEESEGELILKSILIIKVIRCLINKNNVLLIQIIVNMKRCKSNTTKFYYGVMGQINDNMFRPFF